MNENVSDFIINLVVVLFFVVAVTLFFVMQDFSADMLSFLRSEINNEEEVLKVSVKDEAYLISGEEIIAGIISGTMREFYLDSSHYLVSYPLKMSDYSAIDTYASYTLKPKCDTDGNTICWEYKKITP
ncbi:MAG: hypothetical protein GX567_03940 [Clostridia bacterium]|nr:hypothetical protein [Clostridia bacterium]